MTSGASSERAVARTGLTQSAAALISTLALHGDGERVARLLARHPHASFSAAAVDASGRTPLHYAVADAAAAAAIAARSPALQGVADLAGLTPLHHAVLAARLDVLRALLAAPLAPVNLATADAPARAALHLAAAHAHADALALLLDAGALVGLPDARGGTPLHYVAAAAHAPDAAVQACVALLLERGAFLDARDEAGETPLHWAARTASRAGVRALLDAGADPGAVSTDGESPLVTAGVAKRSAAIAADAAELDRATHCEAALTDAHQRIAAAAKKHGTGAGDASARFSFPRYAFV